MVGAAIAEDADVTLRHVGVNPTRTGVIDILKLMGADIEVLNGLNDGEEIITGSYKIIRTLRNAAKVKVDNAAPAKTEG